MDDMGTKSFLTVLLMLFSSCVCRCGAPLSHTLRLKYVDENLSTISSKLTAEMSSLGFRVITSDDGIIVEQDTESVIAMNKEEGASAVGWFLIGKNRIVIAEPWKKLPSGNALATIQVTATLAHEYGHAMGLVHTKTGIMSPQTCMSCIGHEAESLAIAFIEQDGTLEP